MKILVLGGGNSTEREISLRSAKAVANNLRIAGFEVLTSDPRDNTGFPVDVIVFPILHGQGGEDGSIQLKIEKMNLPYLGTNSSASAVCFDKTLTRLALKDKSLPIARGDKVTAQTYNGHELKKRSHVLKVNQGGSSIGTYIVRQPNNVDNNKIAEVFSLDSEAVIEELVEGIEITVPILDAEALPVIEIVPPSDGEFDYENKYNGKTKEICPPVSIDQKLQQQAQDLAKKTHQVLKARHLSRVDMIVRPNGEIIILELNTMPGMTDQSLYPLSAKQAGITMPDLMKKFVDLVKRDYKL